MKKTSYEYQDLCQTGGENITAFCFLCKPCKYMYCFKKTILHIFTASNKTDGDIKSDLIQDRDGGASSCSGTSNQQLVVTPDVAQFSKDEDDEDVTGQEGAFEESADGFEYAGPYGDNSSNDMGILEGAGTSGIDGNKGRQYNGCFNHFITHNSNVTITDKSMITL